MVTATPGRFVWRTFLIERDFSLGKKSVAVASYAIREIKAIYRENLLASINDAQAAS